MKLKLPAHFYLLVTTILVFTAVLTRGAATPTGQGRGGLNGADVNDVEVNVNGGVATLYTVDPISQSFCFGDGQPGHVFQANAVRNRCSDIDFGNYNPGSFTVGIEGGRTGAIIDLGTPSELERFDVHETVGFGQTFAALRIEDGKVVLLKDSNSRSTQELKDESQQLFQEGKSGASASVRLGHIYLLRITDRHDKKFQRMVKLIVIAHTPNQSVTIRWHLL